MKRKTKTMKKELKLITITHYNGIIEDSKLALFRGDIKRYDKLQERAKKLKELYRKIK